MTIDINHQKFNSKAIYQKGQLASLNGWNGVKRGKVGGRTYTVYQKTFHHNSKIWKMARGALVVAATLFSLGIAYQCSKKIQNLWQQAKTGDEIRKIKVQDENLAPKTQSINAIGTSVIADESEKEDVANYAAFFENFTADCAWYLNPENVDTYKKIIDNKGNSGFGYNIGYTNLLMANYFTSDPSQNNQKARSYIALDGTSALPLKDRVTFAQELSTSEYLDEITHFLKREIQAHPAGMRPAKIFLPICCNTLPIKHLTHAVLLVIEPDQEDEKKANITLINTWGKNKTFKNDEKLIENAVRAAYPDCRFVKNNVRTYSGPYCAIDVLENARLLANVDDVQQYILDGKLPTRDKNMIDQCVQEHARQMQTLLETLGKW